jgi:glutathione synthase/RimK-type ligase-like ATP-grasp enzyme
VISEDVTAPEFQRYAAVNTSTVIRALVGILAQDVPVINLPVIEARSINKPYQLRAAERVGLAVPETLISQDRDEIMAYVDEITSAGGQVILKPVFATHEASQSTQRFDQNLQEHLEAAAFCPTIFQRYVEGLDLRINIVGDQVFTMVEQPSGECDPVDIRLDFNASRRGFDLLPEHRDAVLALHRELDLTFGAYDCKLDRDGTLWFLEVNPSGQWLWAEAEAGLPISECLARALCFGTDADIAPQFAPLTEADVEPLRGEPLNVVYARAMRDRIARQDSRV